MKIVSVEFTAKNKKKLLSFTVQESGSALVK